MALDYVLDLATMYSKVRSSTCRIQINLKTMQLCPAPLSFRYMVCPWHINALHSIHQSTHHIPSASPAYTTSSHSIAQLTLADAAGGRKQPESYARTQPRGSDTWSWLQAPKRVRPVALNFSNFHWMKNPSIIRMMATVRLILCLVDPGLVVAQFQLQPPARLDLVLWHHVQKS